MEHNDWLDIEVLEDYLDGKLDAKMMYRVERESLEDPFVAQALAGLSQSPKRAQSLSLLQKQLEGRIANQQEDKKKVVITWQRLSIAATAALIFVLCSIMFWMRYNNSRAVKAPAVVEVNLDPARNSDVVMPEKGWPAFFSYLKENNRLTKQGRLGKSVELSFTIGKDGKPGQIKVDKSLDQVHDEEAIRLIKAGPVWKIPTDPAPITKINIEF